MTDALEELGSALDDLVRGVPGVVALYRPGGLLGRIVAAGRTIARVGAEAGCYVDVENTSEGVSVVVAIGVDAGSAAETCRAVYGAITAWLDAHDQKAETVTVTVAHVAG